MITCIHAFGWIDIWEVHILDILDKQWRESRNIKNDKKVWNMFYNVWESLRMLRIIRKFEKDKELEKDYDGWK